MAYFRLAKSLFNALHNKRSTHSMTEETHKTEEQEINPESSENSNTAEPAEEQNTDDVTELKQEVGELKEKYLRLYSEFDNYKKRTTKERIELFKTAGQDIMTALLPVLDDFDRTMKSLEQNGDLQALREGVQLVHHKFRTILEQQGLSAFSAINEDFDPDLHEAITNIPAPNEEMKGKVIDEVEKGYKLNDKLIRFAKVVVGE